jgi:hypothetical protein
VKVTIQTATEIHNIASDSARKGVAARALQEASVEKAGKYLLICRWSLSLLLPCEYIRGGT